MLDVVESEEVIGSLEMMIASLETALYQNNLLNIFTNDYLEVCFLFVYMIFLCYFVFLLLVGG